MKINFKIKSENKCIKTENETKYIFKKKTKKR